MVKTPVTVLEALRALENNLSAREHEFWTLDQGVLQIHPEIRRRLMGHHQLSDAFLLDLAIRKEGKLATFDQRLEQLLEPRSDFRSSLEILPAE